ncbi:MAG: Lsr2 family protein [Candidatus Nanopelagicales bacterium]|nr:Lsr2 family protein [Candidatus Nanopelagicales bacterium]
MARRTQTILIDDLDGSSADETVLLALDGVDYEIDLSAENAAELREALASYLEVARRASRRRGGRGGARRSSAGVDPAAVRAWAREEGVPVSERGRISSSVVEQFLAARQA